MFTLMNNDLNLQFRKTQLQTVMDLPLNIENLIQKFSGLKITVKI
jgi:hypothetical protein